MMWRIIKQDAVALACIAFALLLLVLVLSGCKSVDKPSSVPESTSVEVSDEPALDPVIDDTPYYVDCTAVRAAGVAPLHENDPGYRAALDRDHDGMACES